MGDLEGAPVSGPTPADAPAPATPKRTTPSKPMVAKPATAPAAKPRSPPVPSVPTHATVPKAPPVVRPAAPREVVAPPPPVGVVVDASGLVLGRAASVIAKRLLKGEHIVVVNAEQSVVVGERSMVLETYRADRARGSKRTGPHFPRYPDRIFRRTVRGMLPHLKSRGKAALDRLQVHIGIPPEFEGRGRETIGVAQARPALRRPITLGEISRFLGARV